MTLAELEELSFKWLSSEELKTTHLQECAELFSNHYGEWGPSSTLSGRVRLGANQLLKYLKGEESWAALAFSNNTLIGYAFAVRSKYNSMGTVTWVTQLVVHKNYRNRGVATRILNSIWGFSDHFAWGIVSANPYAVRALEKSTRRRCTPSFILKYGKKLRDLLGQTISYLSGKELILNDENSIIDTKFHIDHSHIKEGIDKIEAPNSPWLLGKLNEGEEWFAVTFKEQEQLQLSTNELTILLHDADRTVRRAYQGMQITSKSQLWARHASHEIDFILDQLQPEKGSTFLDFGCGTGRHSIELAKRGFQVVGVDFVDNFINLAKQNAEAENLRNIDFITGDCRHINLASQFHYAICLYDVVGSFPDDEDNLMILQNLFSHLSKYGQIALSVMNFEITLNQAKHIHVIQDEPDKLLELPPSRTMQNTGDVFNPDYYIVDPEPRIIYRKEQFDATISLPCELIVRDRRYTQDELMSICSNVGFTENLVRFVRAGQWENSLSSLNSKEILYIGTKK